jgi:hypothetical protein
MSPKEIRRVDACFLISHWVFVEVTQRLKVSQRAEGFSLVELDEKITAPSDILEYNAVH